MTAYEPSREIDPDSMDRLIHGGLILGGLALGDMIDSRLRWVAYGAAGALAASAFTGWRPSRMLYPKTSRANGSMFHGEDVSGVEFAMHEGDASSFSESRIPVGAGVGARERPWDPDDRPAPSPDGDLGLAD
jgi:hypothetical protein